MPHATEGSLKYYYYYCPVPKLQDNGALEEPSFCVPLRVRLRLQRQRQQAHAREEEARGILSAGEGGRGGGGGDQRSRECNTGIPTAAAGATAAADATAAAGAAAADGGWKDGLSHSRGWRKRLQLVTDACSGTCHIKYVLKPFVDFE